MSVLDASALLALINDEPGADLVAEALEDGVISAVNLAEVVTKLIDLGIAEEEAWAEASGLVAEIAQFEIDQARATARLRGATRSAGLSLGDRACLALAEQLGMPVLTADRAWAGLSVGIDVLLIRP